MEAAWLLQQLSQGATGEPVVLGDSEREVLAALVARGLVEAAPDVTTRRAELGELRDKMRAVAIQIADRATPGPAQPALRAEQDALRRQILELSEAVARGEGAARVQLASGDGPYRAGGGAAATAYRLTYAGRALLSDLAPRLSRVAGLELDVAQRGMESLRGALSARASKAAAILALITRELSRTPELALRAAAVGLAARNESPQALGDAFLRAHRSLGATNTWNQPKLSIGARELAAECLCLGTSTLPPASSAGPDLIALRDWLLSNYSAGRDEDAFDSAVVLVAMGPTRRDAVIEQCKTLAAEFNVASRGKRLPLALALLVVVSGAAADGVAAHRIAGIEGALRLRGTPDAVSPGAAAILALVPGDTAAAVDRFVSCRDFLSRFASEATGLEPALLSTLAIDVTEILDDVRLAASEVQRHRLAAGGAEAMSLGIKLLLEVAVLAAGREGDPEEALTLAPYAVEKLPGLGLSILATTLPVALNAVASFHLPAVGYSWVATQSHPAHSSVIFAGGGGRSWG